VERDWVEDFIRWGLTKSHRPWLESTALGYRRELAQIQRKTGKRPELLNADDLEAYQAARRAESASTWNGRYHAFVAFFKYLESERYYEQADAAGNPRRNPMRALKRRRPEPKGREPSVDIVAAIADMGDPKDKLIASFLYHSMLTLTEAQSIKDEPRGEEVRVRRRGNWEWAQVRRPALDALEELGGTVPLWGYTPRTIQKRWPIPPTEFTKAGKRDFGRGGMNANALSSVMGLLVGRADLVDVARAYRDGAEALEGPKPKPATAITAAARALQEMFTWIGAKGNSLGPLFDSARSRGLLQPHDRNLIDALERLVDWVNADRSERGDAHKRTAATREDAEMTLNIVSAVIVRLASLKSR
jgi:hypothetical protein